MVFGIGIGVVWGGLGWFLLYHFVCTVIVLVLMIINIISYAFPERHDKLQYVPVSQSLSTLK